MVECTYHDQFLLCDMLLLDTYCINSFYSINLIQVYFFLVTPSVTFSAASASALSLTVTLTVLKYYSLCFLVSIISLSTFGLVSWIFRFHYIIPPVAWQYPMDLEARSCTFVKR